MAVLALAMCVSCGPGANEPAGSWNAPTLPGTNATPVTPATPVAPSPSLRGTDGQFATIDGANVLARGARVINPGVTHDQLLELTAANSAFALDLYRELAAAGDDNILLGPHSISTALAMIHAGARGQTATDMSRVLHFDSIGSDVAPRFNALDFALLAREQPGAVELRLAYLAFTAPGLPLTESYLETL